MATEYKVEVKKVDGARPFDRPDGKAVKPGGSFTTVNREWIDARRHWHFLEISEVVTPKIETPQETLPEPPPAPPKKGEK